MTGHFSQIAPGHDLVGILLPVFLDNDYNTVYKPGHVTSDFHVTCSFHCLCCYGSYEKGNRNKNPYQLAVREFTSILIKESQIQFIYIYDVILAKVWCEYQPSFSNWA